MADRSGGNGSSGSSGGGSAGGGGRGGSGGGGPTGGQKGGGRDRSTTGVDNPNYDKDSKSVKLPKGDKANG